MRESKLFSFSFSAAQNAPSSSTNLLSRIKEPVILKGDSTVAYRDPTAVWHDGTLFLYFTLVEWEPDGTGYHRLGMTKSSDLITWTTPKPLTPRDLNLNYCAPGNV